MDMNNESTVLVTCSPGLTDYVAAELDSLGYPVSASHKAGVETRTSLVGCMLLNLRLRTAFNVLWLLDEFTADSTDSLYDHIQNIKWEQIIPADGYLSVVSRVDTPSIDNTMFANMKVKDAIVDRISLRSGRRPDSGHSKKGAVVHLYWKDQRCWIYLNTSGRKLADRGYRKMPGKAPLQETLAAGILMATRYDRNEPLVLPMCGIGTLAIEAALMALDRAPGLLRSNFGIRHIKGFDEDAWQRLRLETKKAGISKLKAPIIATDIDPNMIAAAKQNARTAGVEHLIDFDVCDFARTPIPAGPGRIIINPEYGQRLGEVKQLEALYKSIGDFFKQKCPGYTGYIFTGNMDLAKKVGLRTKSKTQFFNGSIECRLLEYELYK